MRVFGNGNANVEKRATYMGVCVCVDSASCHTHKSYTQAQGIASVCFAHLRGGLMPVRVGLQPQLGRHKGDERHVARVAVHALLGRKNCE